MRTIEAVSKSNTWLGSNDGLTARESQVIIMCADGLSNQEIADALFVNIETVKSHLKRAYGRLGIRNRAEVATYVHHHRDTGRFTPLDDRPRITLPLAEQLGLGDAVLAERRQLMGLSATTRRPLTNLAGDVATSSETYAARLLDRWHAAPPTAPFIENPVVAERLAQHQAQYLQSLFGSDLDEHHVEMVLRIGATHHRLQLLPQWHLASYAHLIGDHLDLLFAHAPDRQAFLGAVEVLVRSVLFDASLMLDAYEMHLAQEILEDQAEHAPEAATPLTPDLEPTENVMRSRSAPPSMTRLGADLTQVQVRLDFIELDPERLAILHRLGPKVEAAIPAMLENFYELVAETPSIAELVDEEATSRLMIQVDSYWRELLSSSFDRSHAASRMRVGMVHERIGLAPQFYVAGLARQFGGILDSLVGLDEPLVDAVDALVRAVFFDLTFVIDAYVEARAAALVQTEQFASQLIAGLSTGIAIVDARNRIEVANQQLLDLVGISATVAHRMPVADALPFSGVVELIDAVRDSAGQRRSSVVTFRNTTLRLTMLGLQLSATGRVGMVIDDISAIMRLGDERLRENQRLLDVLSAVGAVAWELDHDTLLFLAVSAEAESLLGQPEHELLGRVVFTDLIPDAGERVLFEKSCGEVRPGEIAQLDHLLPEVSGVARRARTTIAASQDLHGHRTTSGVTIVLTESQQTT